MVLLEQYVIKTKFDFTVMKLHCIVSYKIIDNIGIHNGDITTDISCYRYDLSW